MGADTIEVTEADIEQAKTAVSNMRARATRMTNTGSVSKPIVPLDAFEKDVVNVLAANNALIRQLTAIIHAKDFGESKDSP